MPGVNNERIHVLDDSVTIRAMMVRVLETDLRLKAIAVGSADEAEKALATGKFDVATLDVQMPGRGGLEFLEQLVGRYRLPTVMLSASTAAGSTTRVQCFEAGAAACFDKADILTSSKALVRLVKGAAAGRRFKDPTDTES